MRKIGTSLHRGGLNRQCVGDLAGRRRERQRDVDGGDAATLLEGGKRGSLDRVVYFACTDLIRMR